MERPRTEKTHRSPWQACQELQQLVAQAGLHDVDEKTGAPVPWRDRRGRGVSTMVLKGVLNALLAHYPNMFPSIATICARSGQKPRTVQRAIEVLQAKDVLAVETTRTARGQKQNRYTILGSKLAFLGGDGRLPLFQTAESGKRRAGQSQAPPATNPCATGNGPCATCHQPKRHGGALTLVLSTKEDQTQEGAAEAAGREFSVQERGELVRQASRMATIVGRPTSDQEADELIGLAVLVLDGQISERELEESLAATERNSAREPRAYFLGCLRKRLAERGADLDELLGSHKC